MTEGFRATRASERFEQLWDEAKCEDILLDAKKDIEHFSIKKLITHLVNVSSKIEIENYDRFAVEFKGKIYYTESISLISGEEPAPKKRRYHVKVIFDGVNRGFEKDTLKEALQEAYLFARWVVSEEGQAAVEILNDW